MRTTSAFDRDWYSDYYFRPLSYWRAHGGKRADGPVVLEQFKAAEGRGAALAAWIEDAVRPRQADPNQRSRTITMLSDEHQMLRETARHDIVMITRVTDLDAAQSDWTPLAPPAELVVDQDLSFWRPITEPLTIDDMLNPTSAAVAGEERARARMGTDFLPRSPKLA
jgi:hypothetical protein